MKWVFDTPAAGDIVRVRLGQIYHYGIYVSDGEVIQFGPPPVGQLPPAEEVAVLSTDIASFLCGNFLEVGRLGFSERRRARSRQAAVAYARSRLGTKGYHLLYNNCEHFVNECVFGRASSAQVDGVRSTVRALQSIGYQTIASGDSYNDLDMIKASQAGFLFRSPERIRQEFDMSKNAFKRAVGRLLKAGKIKITEKSIEILNR